MYRVKGVREFAETLGTQDGVLFRDLSFIYKLLKR